MAVEIATDWMRLNWPKRGQVLVTSRQGDRFIIESIEEAAVACQQGQDIIDFRRQVSDLLLPRLSAWIKEHRARVQKAFLTLRDGYLLFLVIRKQVRYDEEFTDRLTDLDIEIARNPDLDHVQMNVLALPAVTNEGAESFVSPRWALEYVGA